MLGKLRFVRAIGQFHSVNSAATIDLGKLVLIYAENARGKTTLAAILRSLGTGEALPITERKRLGAIDPPQAVIECSGSSSPACFQNGMWSRTCPEVLVFDDFFVDQNVYSGMDVDAAHRQNLHDWILGATGVALARRVDELAARIRAHNGALRELAGTIPAFDRYGLSVDEFCALTRNAAVDEAITAAQQRVAAFEHANAVRSTAPFMALSLPVIDVERTRMLLERTVADLDSEAVQAVRQHFDSVGQGAEEWVQTGMRFLSGSEAAVEDDCPFCDQSLTKSPIIHHYRAYFGKSYRQLLEDLRAAETQLAGVLSGDALAGFQRQVRAAEDLRRFWSQFAKVPEITIDGPAVARAWQRARDAFADALKAKRADPLTAVTITPDIESRITAYREVAQQVASCSYELLGVNDAIGAVKESVEAGSASMARTELNRLLATKARHSPANSDRCTAYLSEQAQKRIAEDEKVQAQQQLDVHRASAVPNWETAVNNYLSKLGATFAVTKVQSQSTPGRPSCVYGLVIDGHDIAVGPTPVPAGSPTFKNTLSSGDRNTLALAFFLAALDHDPTKGDRVVVLDDPMSSLDKHRRMNTIQEMRALLPSVAQLVVMSHDEHFLFDVYERLAERNSQMLAQTTALQVRRTGNGSLIEEWDIVSERMSRHDKRHALLVAFANGGDGGDLLPIAQAIRPHLEHFLRAAYPDKFRPGETLRDFRNRARAARDDGSPFITAEKFSELDQIVEYSSEYHHDTNPAYDSATINDTQLRNFVQRAIAFVAI